MTTVHCIEISKFVVSDAAKAAGIALPGPDAIANASPRLTVGWGQESQEPQFSYFIRAWDSTEDEHNPILDASPAPPFDLPQNSELEYRIHVHLTCEPYTALAAPLTEIVTWKLKEGATREKVEELLTSLMKIVNAIPRSAGMHKAGWGTIQNNDPERQYVVMIGWDTMEAFIAAVANSPDGRAVLDLLAEHTIRQIRHVALQRPQAIVEARL